MTFNINAFREELEFGGARASLFSIELQNPVDARGDDKIRFMARSTAIPTSSIGFSEIPYFGRTIKVAGQRRYDDWLITVINDEDFAVRNAMEAWSNAINTHDSNVRALPQDYKSNAIITQFSKDGSALRTYVFEGMFPTDIEPISMSWATQDTVEEFSVTFQYDLWRVEGVTGIPTT